MQANTVLAGDAFGIFTNDDAVVFFGKIASYDKAAKKVTVIPTQKIKGDIKIGSENVYTVQFPGADYEFIHDEFSGKAVPNKFDEFLLEEDASFVMAYGNNWNSEEYNNELLHIYKVTSTDTKTLEIKPEIYHDQVVSAALQQHLNNGDYEQSEIEKLRNRGQIPDSNNEADEKKNNIYLGIIFSVLVLFTGIVAFGKQKIK